MKFNFMYDCAECGKHFYGAMQLDCTLLDDVCGPCKLELAAEDDAVHAFESAPLEDPRWLPWDDIDKGYDLMYPQPTDDEVEASVNAAWDALNFPGENELWVTEQIEGQMADEAAHELATCGHTAAEFTGVMNEERGDDDVPF